MGSPVVESTQIIVDKVGIALNTLATKLGVGVDYIYPIYVKQQVVEGVTTLVALLLIIAIFSIIFAVCIKKPWANPNEQELPTTAGVVGFFAIIAICIAVVIFGLKFTECIGKIVNPQYYALEQIFETCKGLIK